MQGGQFVELRTVPFVYLSLLAYHSLRKHVFQTGHVVSTAFKSHTVVIMYHHAPRTQIPRTLIFANCLLKSLVLSSCSQDV